MKSTILKFTRILTFILFPLVFNCQKDDDTVIKQTTNKPEALESFDWQIKTFKELKTSKKFNKAYLKVTDKIELFKNTSSSKNAMEEMYNFTIDSTSIVEVELGNYTSYTFGIFRDEPSLNYYENLFIEIDSSDLPQASILKYNLNPNTNGVDSIEATKIIYDTTNVSGKIYYDGGGVDCTTISIYYITTCECVGHWPGENCNCTKGGPTSLLINEYTSCDLGGGPPPIDDGVGTITFTSSNTNSGSSGGYYSTHSYSVSNIDNVITQRRKSLKLELGIDNWNWLSSQSEELQGDIFSYLESAINVDGLISNATSYPQEEIDFVISALEIMIENENIDFNTLIYVIVNEQDYRNQMSEDELNLFDTLSNEEQALYLISAKQAIDVTNELFPTPCERYNGKGDAFRHAYWNALSSQRIGVGLTNLLTTKHENRPSHYPFNSKENEMDLFNNQVGRDIVFNGMTNLLLIQEAIQDAFDNGDLRYLNNQDSNCRATFSSQLIPTNQ